MQNGSFGMFKVRRTYYNKAWKHWLSVLPYPEYRSVAITRSLNALALLASGNKKYLSIVKKEAEWASDFTSNGYKTWHYGYVIIFLAEPYHCNV